VADRGRISTETVKKIQERQWQYILGCGCAGSKEAPEVIGRGGRYHEVHAQSTNPQAPGSAEGERSVGGATRFLGARTKRKRRRIGRSGRRS
jgi:hypothetical protein